MKTCKLCLLEKENSNFYPNRAKCKTCYSGLVMEYRHKNIDWRREYNARYRREQLANNEEYKYKDTARKKLWWATVNGKVKKKPCEICGSKAEAHHHEGYDKPLNVKWLCKTHHMEAHNV